MHKSVFVACIAAAMIAGSMIASSGGWASSTHAATSQASSAKKLHATVYSRSPAHTPLGTKASAGVTSSAQSAASRQNPCTLVTASEAGVLLHAAVQRETEAPLGPTCILQVKGEKQGITFALEKVSVAGQIRKMKHRRSQPAISGHAAYCGVLGTPLLYVELSGGRALEVTAPCAAARALAARALPRITG